MSKICMHYIICGRVQSVCYRAAAQQEAKKLKLTGWVVNSNNGDVEVLACGEQEALKTFEKWLWQGPMLAKVESVKSNKLLWQEYEDFIIRY